MLFVSLDPILKDYERSRSLEHDDEHRDGYSPSTRQMGVVVQRDN